MNTLKCVVCGKEFQSNRNALVCGIECKKIKGKERATEYYHREKEKKKRKKRESNLEQTLNEAKAAGLSYGKYVAMKNGYLF